MLSTVVNLKATKILLEIPHILFPVGLHSNTNLSNEIFLIKFQGDRFLVSLELLESIICYKEKKYLMIQKEGSQSD